MKAVKANVKCEREAHLFTEVFSQTSTVHLGIFCGQALWADSRDLKQTLEAVRWRQRWPHGSGLRPSPLGAKLEH